MIVVIADDVTGAAELAGIGLRYGLKVEMSTAVNETDTELLVMATDTRSMKEVDAIAEIKKVTNEVMLLKPELIFKKIDSVLRGHVIAELKEQLKMVGLNKALVVAANPLLGRTIRDGKYFYNDDPIHLSSFSNDPEFAIKNSDVFKMLRTDDKTVQLKKITDDISQDGIFIGEVKSGEDLQFWASRYEKNILPAGGAGFFSAILETLGIKKGEEKKVLPGEAQTTLFVCGSTFNKSREAIKEIKRKEGPVSYMPEAVIRSGENDDEIYQVWSSEIVSIIQVNGKAIISIDPESINKIDISAVMLREKTAIVVKKVFEQETVHELFIEGGSTAAAIIRELGFETFMPVEELAPGVVRMRVKERDDLHITVKPGSYQWPADVWDF